MKSRISRKEINDEELCLLKMRHINQHPCIKIPLYNERHQFTCTACDYTLDFDMSGTTPIGLTL